MLRAEAARGFFVVAKDMPGNSNSHRCWSPRSAPKWCGPFFASLGEMPSDGNGREYRPPRQRGDFIVAEEMPDDGGGQRCWPPRPE